jgi:hypothetical protein
MIDERFLMHRLRSSSVAGMVGGTAAGGLFLYRMFVDQVRDWDLFAVLATIALVKVALMIYFRLRG